MWELSDLDPADIAIGAVKEDMKKHKKYCTLLDESDTYTATVQDPRVSGRFILEEFREDEDAGKQIIENIRLVLQQKYPRSSSAPEYNSGISVLEPCCIRT
jgi:hypothetical protein